MYKSNLLTCLFGFHNYSDEITKDKSGFYRYLCITCKRNGYYKNNYGIEYWNDYDDKGNTIHFRGSGGYEEWYEYDDKGNIIYSKYHNGYEKWLHNGKWIEIKPLNWEYEKYVK